MTVRYSNLSIIVAVADNGIIGHQNQLPWHLPEDLRQFRSLTEGHSVIMGRKTFESIGRPLPKRRNIVLSRQTTQFAGCDHATSLEKAIAQSPKTNQLFVIGGAELYQRALTMATTVYLTRVHRQPIGDVTFPDFPIAPWQKIQSTAHTSSTTGIGWTFEVYSTKPVLTAQ